MRARTSPAFPSARATSRQIPRSDPRRSRIAPPAGSPRREPSPPPPYPSPVARKSRNFPAPSPRSGQAAGATSLRLPAAHPDRSALRPTRFKKVLRSAKIQGYLKVMPTDDIRFSNPNKDDTLRKQVLDGEELQKLANTHCGNSEVKKAFLFACYTSLGFAEIRELTWGNINKSRLITHRKKTGELINNRLNPTALAILGTPKKKDDFVFNVQDLSINGLNKTIGYWVQRAEINKHITFYCARHTFACLLLMNGANLKTVADAMGHRSTKSTLKYLNFINKLQDEAIDNLPALKIA